MAFSDSFKTRVNTITSAEFDTAALELFDYQWNENAVYQEYCRSLSKNPANVRALTEIPFLPIGLFKSQKIISGKWSPADLFKSSGTTSEQRSIHYVRDLDFYHQNARKCFEYFYGPLANYSIKALLPSYQQQGDSSLIAMVDYFMRHAAEDSGYFLDDKIALAKELETSPKSQRLLLGVSYALLDLAEQNRLRTEGTIIMETGGMKGRRHEITRTELHEYLQFGLGVEAIHSEYGMTELMSQAYAKSQGIFEFPPWTRVFARDINDPFDFVNHSRIGGVNVVDLANVDTCAFIETMDLGRKKDDSKFEIVGRFDNSDIRGCNLLIG